MAANKPTNNPMKTNKVRIIAGTHKRRFITFADINGLRPTPDRLRETLFNWLMPHLPQANVLDMCAGSGVLGLECISRGAAHCTLIEPHKKQFAMLSQSVAALGMADKVTLLNKKAEAALARHTQEKAEFHAAGFDLVFLDPPYQLNLWQPLLTILFEKKLLAENALIYLEADKPHAAIPLSTQNKAQLSLLKEAKVGQVFAGLYEVPN